MSRYPSDVWSGRYAFATLPAMQVATEPISKDEIRARLQLTREALELSQADLCRMTGISTQAWNNAETGDNRISVNDAIKLCRVTGVTLDWIYRGIMAGLPQKIVEAVVSRQGSRRRA